MRFVENEACRFSFTCIYYLYVETSEKLIKECI